MITENELNIIKESTTQLLQKMTVTDFQIEVSLQENTKTNSQSKIEDIVDINLSLKEPQFLIGKDGQNLFDLQRILKILSNKKLQKNFYLKLDINNYQKQKIEYLKNLAKSLADEVVLTKEKKVLSPMPANERRIIHEELSQRQDVVVQSEEQGEKRHITIAPL